MTALAPADETLSDIERFHRDGYLVVDNFFDRTELREFEQAFRQVAFRTDGEIYDAIAFMPEFMRLAAKRQTAMWANMLLGRKPFSPLYCFLARCRIDPPHDERRTYGWHQQVFYSVPHGRFVQTWAPLIRDTTKANGTIWVCPGSHHEGIAPQTWTEGAPGCADQIIVDPDAVAKYQQIQVPMTLGQIMFFDSRLFHRSGTNLSEETRYSLIGMYHDTDAPAFRPPVPKFEFRGMSPRQWFEERAGA